MIPVAALKIGAQIVAGLGVSKIVNDIVQNNVVVTTTAQKVCVWAGNLVIGSMIVEQSSNFIERSVVTATASYQQKKAEQEAERTTQ